MHQNLSLEVRQDSTKDDGPLKRSSTPWWSEADTTTAQGFDGLRVVSDLLAARIIRHLKNEKESLPERGASEALIPEETAVLYEAMGANDPGTKYVAVWLNMDDASLVFLSKVVNNDLFEQCVRGNFMKERAKLVISPVAMALPFPAKAPRDADTVGDFFKGKCNAVRCVTPSGASVQCIQIDFFSIWFLRLAIRKVGFRLGNVLDLFVVDYAERAVLASCRLSVTEYFNQLMS
jgi:hypothetical protein